MTWTMESEDERARTGWLSTPHGQFETPAFMPVGTRATVKAVDNADLRSVGSDVILANTYHLMLRPGTAVVGKLGGLHEFMGWDGPILTDSGGFQIFSLDPEISEEGARFRSVYDGSRIQLSPEDAIRRQEELGADIAMVLDVCVGLPADPGVVDREMRRTLRWAERCLSVHSREDQALFGIVQGGIDPDLRSESAEQTAALGFPGFGIGGLSVGENTVDRNRALDAAITNLPAGKPRYVMGLGDTDGLLDGIERGADLFDCVLPTRLARHGKVLTRRGDINIKNARFEVDDGPLEDDCDCSTCAGYSRAYLRHLFRLNELTSHRLLTIHNLRHTLRLLEDARAAIKSATFSEFAADVRSRSSDGSS